MTDFAEPALKARPTRRIAVALKTRPTLRVALACAALLAAHLVAQPSPQPPVLVTGARILDAEAGRYLRPSAVLIQGGKIASISADEPGTLPAGVERLTLQDATLVPGLIDARAVASPSADLDAAYFHLLALAHGVTAERALNLQSSWGLAQNRRIDAGTTLAPRLWVGGRGIDQGARPDLWLFDAADAAAARREAGQQVVSGVDWIAGYDHLAPDVYRAMTVATRGTRVRAAAVPGASSMSDLAAAGVHSIDTMNWPLAPRKSADPAAADRAWIDAGSRDLNALARRLASARVTLVPLLAGLLPAAWPDDVRTDAALALLPAARRDAILAKVNALARADQDRARRAWTVRAAFLVRFVRARGRVVAGSGFGLAGYPVPGAGLHTELGALVRAGLTPAEALCAATTNAAAMLGAGRALGRIAVGRDADFIVVAGDPLKNVGDLSRITHVIRRGEILDPKALLSSARR